MVNHDTELYKGAARTNSMDEPVSNLHFKIMSLGYLFRDTFLRPKDILKEAGIKPGFHVLDYGCGLGSFTFIAAEIVGESGTVYAVDIQPLAIQSVQTKAAKKGLTNVETILSDCKTGLKDNIIDVVLLYDIFHMLQNPDDILQELHRLLKREGILSFSDHHLKEDKILSGVTKNRLFALAKKGKETYTFTKEG